MPDIAANPALSVVAVAPAFAAVGFSVPVKLKFCEIHSDPTGEMVGVHARARARPWGKSVGIDWTIFWILTVAHRGQLPCFPSSAAARDRIWGFACMGRRESKTEPGLSF